MHALVLIGKDPVVVPVHAESAASVAVLRRAGLVPVAPAELEPNKPVHSRQHLVLRHDPQQPPMHGPHGGRDRVRGSGENGCDRPDPHPGS